MSWEEDVSSLPVFSGVLWHVLWVRPGGGGQDADLLSAGISDLASAVGGARPSGFYM